MSAQDLAKIQFLSNMEATYGPIVMTILADTISKCSTCRTIGIRMDTTRISFGLIIAVIMDHPTITISQDAVHQVTFFNNKHNNLA
jgi:hypothetical protein